MSTLATIEKKGQSNNIQYTIRKMWILNRKNSFILTEKVDFQIIFFQQNLLKQILKVVKMKDK